MTEIKTILGGLTLALVLSQAANAGGYRDYAQVTRVDPLYERVSHRVPEQHCHIERHAYRERSGGDSHTGTIVGGILGAALGNELGHKKRNKQVGAVAGGLLGASIGRDLSRADRGADVRYRDREVCETRYQNRTERELVGYRVHYRYRGQTYQTRTDRHPGDKMPVTVDVRPAL